MSDAPDFISMSSITGTETDLLAHGQQILMLTPSRAMCRLKAGADAFLKDADGQTPLDKALAQVGSTISMMM